MGHRCRFRAGAALNQIVAARGPKRQDVIHPAAAEYLWRSGNCVEVVGDLPGAVRVRDSKDPDGRALVFTTGAWRAFVGQAKSR